MALDFAIGCTAGAVSGLLGIGGAFVIVPALVWFHRMDQRQAHATALATTAIAATAAAVTYVLNRTSGISNENVLALGALMASAPISAVVAARRLPSLSEVVVRRVFGATLLTLVPLVLLVAPHHLVIDGWMRTAVLVVAGVIAGTLSGLLGIGSGLLLVPLLMFVAVDRQIVAQGMSLLAIAPTAVAGSVVHFRNGMLRRRAVPLLGVGALAGAVAGSRMAHFTDDRLLQWLLIVTLVIVGTQQLLRPPMSRRPVAAV